MNFPRLLFSSLALTLTLLASSAIIAQTPPKNIYELFGLKSGGCNLDILKDPIRIEEVPEDMPVDFARKKPKELSNEQIENLFISLRQSNLAVKGKPQIIKLANGNTLFSENNKWGLKKQEGLPIIPPGFDMVYADTISGGFSGYTGAKCNYFDESGNKVLPKKYYHVEAVAKSSYIVREAGGYGLIISGKEILPAKMLNIKKETNNGRTYYKIHSEEKGEYILLDDLKTEIPFPFWDNAQFIGQKFLKMTNNLINLETKKCLICEKGYEISILDEENQIAAFNKIGQRVWYLIDFQGNLLTTKPFTYFRKFNQSGTAIAGIRNPDRGPYQISGLINSTGGWVLEPVYQNIYESGNYIVATDGERNTAVFDQKGNPIIPAKKQNVQFIKDDMFVISSFINLPGAEQFRPYRLNIKTGKQEEIGINFLSIRSLKVCNEAFYVITLNRKEKVLDEQFKTVTGVHQRILSNDDGFILGSSHNKRTKQKRNGGI